MMYLGIDLSKLYFDATLQKENGEQVYAQFENNEKGFAQLGQWLPEHQVSELHACMEATNIYWEGLAQYLYDQGYTLSMVNPARIKGCALSQLQRNKTDKLDSQVIVAFCAALKPRAWQPPTASQSKLRCLEYHRQALVKPEPNKRTD